MKPYCERCGIALGPHDEDDERRYGVRTAWSNPDGSVSCWDCSDQEAIEASIEGRITEV